ncbi:MAG: AI-2E family transporter [Planctomycetota bacterium]
MTHAPDSDARTRERRVQTVCLVVLTVIAVGTALYALQDVMVPFALASFLSIALAPVVDGLSARTRLSRPVSVGLTMLLGALLLAILGGVVASSIAEFEASAFASQKGANFAERVQSWLRGHEGPIADGVQAVVKRVREAVPALVGTLGGILGQGATVLVILMFLLVEQGRSEPQRDPGAPEPIGVTVREKVKRYISVKVLTSVVTGVAVGLSLWAIGAPTPVLLGLLTFLLNFIPTIGSVIALALPFPLLLAAEADIVTIALALALPGAIQFVVGQIWENKLLGDAFDLRASVVLLALVFWGKVWGIIGMLLATPITAVLKTLMEGWDLTAPLARTMGQRGTVPPGAERAP